MTAKKRTPALERKIAAAKRAGASTPELAARFGLAGSTVHAAIKADEKRRKPKRKLASEPKAEPKKKIDTSRKGLAAELGDLLGELRTDAAKLRAEGETSALGALNRTSVSVMALIERLTDVPSPEDEGLVLVPAADMSRVAEDVRARLRRMVEQVELGPPCPACGARTPATEAQP